MITSSNPYRLTRNEYFAFSAISAIRSSWWFMLLYISFGLAVYLRGAPENRLFGEFVIAVGIFAPFYRGLAMILNPKTRIVFTQDVRVEWDETEMRFYVQEERRGGLVFAQIYRVREFGEFFQIFQRKGLSVFLPKRVFEKAEIDSLRDRFRENRLVR